MLTPETILFIKEHQNDDVRLLALQSRKYPQIDMKTAVTQISGWQTARHKIPSWQQVAGILYPPHLSLEQCSSEWTATYKASLANGKSLADLTGGFGIDCAFMSCSFEEVTYVEQQAELCQIAGNNFTQLGLGHIHIVNADSTEYLRGMSRTDCIFIDPARRNEQGGKTTAISDCEPNVKVLSSLLTEKAGIVIIKLSPMLDLSLALTDMPATKEVHIISADNECKELLLVLGKKTEDVMIHCINLKGNKCQKFSFTRESESKSTCEYTSVLQKYVYEPNSSILKAGGYKTPAYIYKVKKLHPNSHLYTSDILIEDFPGRIFERKNVLSLNRKDIRKQLTGITKANITVRNFPATVAELRKRLKLKDGGDEYLFATTLENGEKVLIQCSRINPSI